ncbi:MAG TPA: hypothetical protein VG889_15495 [Rhizomicrobium sp.]|nr:hypothetical protein [Rhizomicrobium sp.]
MRSPACPKGDRSIAASNAALAGGDMKMAAGIAIPAMNTLTIDVSQRLFVG